MWEGKVHSIFFHIDTDFYALQSEHEAAFRKKNTTIQIITFYNLRSAAFKFWSGTLGIFSQ